MTHRESTNQYHLCLFDHKRIASRLARFTSAANTTKELGRFGLGMLTKVVCLKTKMAASQEVSIDDATEPVVLELESLLN